MGKFLNFIGLEETEEEDVFQDEQQPAEPKRRRTADAFERCVDEDDRVSSGVL